MIHEEDVSGSTPNVGVSKRNKASLPIRGMKQTPSTVEEGSIATEANQRQEGNANPGLGGLIPI